jgi:heat shock protein HslJ
MKKLYILLLIITLLLGGYLFYTMATTKEEVPVAEQPSTATTTETVTSESIPGNISYSIDGQEYLLKNGVAEVSIPNSSTKDTVRIFGEPVLGDVDGDGDNDALVLLTKNSGGSGTFFYAVYAILVDGKYSSTNAIFLGDRIAPQNASIQNGQGVVNYAVRKDTDPFTTAPNIGKSLYLTLDQTTGTLEGKESLTQPQATTTEAMTPTASSTTPSSASSTPKTVSLEKTSWKWVKTTSTKGSVVTPTQKDAFVLTLQNGTFSSKTDCNTVGGGYTLGKGTLVFKDMMSTMMFCDGSQEGEYGAMLGKVSSYNISTKNELSLTLSDGEVMLFTK